MRYLLLIPLLSYGCATRPLPQLDKKQLKVDDGKSFIQRKHRYYELLFEQHRDPYYGTPRWSENCLKENVIGKVVEKNNMIMLSSDLYLNADGEAGYCPEHSQAKKYRIIYLACAEGSVLELTDRTISVSPEEIFSFCK